MKDNARFVVLGLGTFGTALASRLSENGRRVTGVDSNERQVEALRDLLYEAVVADVTDRNALKELLLPNAEAVIISLGEQIELSILTALHAKELGARHVYCKGVTPDHGKILKQLGVERVIFPEKEMAIQLADSFTWPNVLNSLQVDSEYSILELAVPSSLAGRTLIEADLRRKYGVSVLAVKDALRGNLIGIPDGNFRLTDDQILLVMGKHANLSKFRIVD
jgi:trk system potassium uptake protein TrkA